MLFGNTNPEGRFKHLVRHGDKAMDVFRKAHQGLVSAVDKIQEEEARVNKYMEDLRASLEEKGKDLGYLGGLKKTTQKRAEKVSLFLKDEGTDCCSAPTDEVHS